MAWYKTGTVSVTNGSATVTGSGTSWIAGAGIGEAFYAPDGKIYEIADIASNTSLTLGSNYLGSTQSAQAYTIIPSQSYIRDLAADAASLISQYAGIATGAGAGKFPDGTVSLPSISFASDVDTGLFRVGTNVLGLATAGTERVRIDTNGNVGVGTAYGLTRLDVANGVSAGAITDVALFTQNTQSNPTIGQGVRLSLAASASLTRAAAIEAAVESGTNAHRLSFLTNPNGAVPVERLRIDSAGTLTNYGNTILGDASTDTVQVNGYMGVGGTPSSNYAIKVLGTTSGNPAQQGVYAGTTFDSTTVSGQSFYSVPATSAAAFTATNISGYRAGNATKGAGSTITNQYGFYIDDQTQGTNNYGITSLVSSGTNKWNIYASGTAANYFAGNVGIGTTTNGSGVRLQVQGGNLRVYDGSGGSYADINHSGNIMTVGTSTGASGTLVFQTGAAQERLRIDSSGNVGIGTSSPASTLDIASAAGDAIASLTATGIQRWQLQTERSTANFKLVNQTGASTALTVTTAGNVGLGVTPSAWVSTTRAIQGYAGGFALSADGTSNNQMRLSSNTYYNGTNWIYYGSSTATSYEQRVGEHRWFTAPSGTAGNAISFTQAMTLDASGNLGIGTSSPGAKLDLGVSATTNQVQAVLARQASPADVNFRLVASTGSGTGTGTEFFKLGMDYGSGNTNAAINFFRGGGSIGGFITFTTNDNTERLRIDASGNVGIGTNSPSLPLHVLGATTTVTGGAQRYNFFLNDSTPLAAGIGGGIVFSGVIDGTVSQVGFAGLQGIKENATSGNNAAALIFTTRPNGGNLVERLRIDSNGNVLITSTGGLGYGTGSGGAVTQITSRTTGVTLNKTNGAITLVSAAGSTTWQSFTVTNSTVAATDVVHVCQKSGTDLYEVHVTAVAAGSFRISFKTTGGTTTEQPVFNFAVIKAVTA